MRTLFSFFVLLFLAAPADAQVRYEWVGGAAGDWTEPTNWSPAGIPAAADTAVVGEEGQGTRIATLTANTMVAGLEVVGLGTVSGDFDLTVIERFVWAAGGVGIGTFQGTGTITNASTSTLFMTEPTSRYQVSAGRTIVNDGLAVWDGSGSWRGEGRLVNNGEMVLAMGESDAFGFIFSSLTDAITNNASGVIGRDGTGAALLSSGFVNDGLIRVETGTLELGGFNSNGGRGTGSIEIDAGAQLVVSGGTHIQDRVTGSSLTVSPGSNRRLEINDAFEVSTTRVTAGVLQLDGTGATETLVMESGFLNGSGTLTVAGSFDWNGGRMEGSGTTILGPGVPLTIGAANVSLGGTRTLRTEGPVTWTGEADLSSSTSTSVFENAGILTSSGPGERQVNFLTFRNTGTLVHIGGTLDFQTRMDNEGTVRAEGGTLRLRSSGSVDSGTYTVAEDGVLAIAGSRTLTETVVVGGTGSVVFENGANVSNRATWRPGTSPGVLAVDSDWPEMEPEGVLDVEIGGPESGTDFDQLAVAGTATLGGTLRITLTDGFEPADGDRFLIIPAAEVDGSFDALDLPDGLEAFVEATDEGAELVIGTPVASEDDAAEARPTAFALHAAYPNPFAEHATLRYDVPEAARVYLVAYDVLGREVAVLADGERPVGRHEVDLRANEWPSGVYLVRLMADGFVQTRRVTLLR